MRGGVFPLEFAKKSKRHLEREMRNAGQETGPKPIFDAPAGGKCKSYWLIWIQSPFTPISGAFEIIVSTDDGTGTITQTTITVDNEESDTDLAAKLRNISNIGDGSDAANDLFTVIGQLPGVSLNVRNKATSGKRITGIGLGINDLARARPQVDPFVFD